jgi:hypothetical protein
MIDLTTIKTNNIIINGIAGCGKTNIINEIIKKYSENKILFFNNNLSINDLNYDIIIIDNIQQLKLSDYKLIKKINNKNTSFCIFGDKYALTKDSNINYLLLTEDYFNFNKLPWIKYDIYESKRIPDKIADFINNCILSENIIKTDLISEIKPKYYICDIVSRTEIIINEFLNKGYNYNDILIITPSLKTFQIKIIIKNLTRKKIPVSNLFFDENKILILSYEQLQDIEKKIVIILNFDTSYLKYSKEINNLYISTTRCLKELVLLHHYKNNYLPFFDKNKLNKYCDVILLCNINIEIKKLKEIYINNLSSNIIDKCMDYIKIVNISNNNNNNYIINELDINVKNHIISKLNLSKNVLFDKQISIDINKYRFIENIDCIDNKDIYKFIYSDNIDNKDYISLAIQKYINDNISSYNIFENYEEVTYNNEQYLIFEIFDKKIKLLNINTAEYVIALKKDIIKKNIEFKYYIYNILTNEINMLISNINEITKLINNILFFIK